MKSEVTSVLTRTGGNLLKTGVALLVSTIVGNLLRETTADTMKALALDIRCIRDTMKRGKSLQPTEPI